MTKLAPCFTCGASEKTPAFDGNCTSFNGSPGYGSRFDNTGSLRIYVCDDCLEKHKDRVTLVTRVQVKTEEDTQSWACPLCEDVAHEGSCSVQQGVSGRASSEPTDNPQCDN